MNSRLFLLLSILAFVQPTFACVKYYPKYRAKGSTFANHFFRLTDSPDGPTFDENDENRMTYNLAQKKWCLDKDCKALYDSGVGSTAQEATRNIPLLDGSDVMGLIVHDPKDPSALVIYSAKPGIKRGSGYTFGQAVDYTKPHLSLKPDASNPKILNAVLMNQADKVLGSAYNENDDGTGPRTRGVLSEDKPEPKLEDQDTDLNGIEAKSGRGCGSLSIDKFESGGSTKSGNGLTGGGWR